MRNHPETARDAKGSFAPGPRPQSPEERFAEKIGPTTPKGCIEWAGAINGAGYGNFWNGHRYMPAHVFSFELHKGPVPKGLVLDHRCCNPRCINPEHLRPVTTRENNLLAKSGFAPTNAAKLCCPEGHEYDIKNTYVDVKGRRYCRTCRMLRERSRRATMKGTH